MSDGPSSRVANAREYMRITITEEKGGLKENKASVPDGRRSAEEGKDELREERLDAEEKGSVHEHCQRQNRCNDALSRSWF